MNSRPVSIVIAAGLLVISLSMSGQPSLNEIDLAIASRDFRKAGKLASSFQSVNGTSPALSLRLGIISSAMSDYQRALTYLAEAEAGGADPVQAALLMAECHETLGDIKAASAKYDELVARDRSNLYIINRYGRMLIDNRLFSEAVRWFQLLVDSVPDNPVYRKNLALCFSQISMDDHAAFHYRISWNLNNRDLGVLTALTNCLLRLKYPGQGLEIINEAVASHPGNPIPHKCRGNLLFAMKQYEGAAEAYLNAYNLGDTAATTARQVGFSYFGAQNYRDAIPYLMKHYMTDTTNIEAAYCLGYSMSVWRMQDEGIDLLRHCIDLMAPDSLYLTNIYTAIGKASNDLNRYREAVDAYLTALNYKPGDPDLIFSLARSYDGAREYRNAIVNYEKFIAHQEEMIRRIAESKGIDTDRFVTPEAVVYARDRVKKLKDELFFMGEIKKIN